MNFKQPGLSEIQQLLQLWKAVFGEYDGFWDLFLDTGFLPENCLCITENGQVTAGLYWFDGSCGSDRFAYIYAVVTDPAHRGRGLCRKLMTQLHTLLADRGYAGAMLVPANEDLRETYRKMGYENCTTISELSCCAENSSVEIRNVGVEEYAALRRNFLPEKGLVQEGVSLSFLAAQAQLFAGEDFLLAAWQEGGTLHGMELLGNTAAAPRILHALGCETGKFQIPGRTRSFAMLCKLRGNAVIPGYFGLAFE